MTDILESEALSPVDGATYAEAIAFARERHDGQVRKGSTTPYVVHPLEAGALLAHYYPDRSSLVTAGFLHDTIEDTRTSRDELAERFGEEVARLVVAVTNRWWKAPWSMDARDPDTVRLKAADCASNIRATVVDLRREGPVVWRRFRGGERAKRDYYRRLTGQIGDALPNEPLTLRLMELARFLDAECPWTSPRAGNR
jgi:(p)ppGpp synthase/HD superfamily hydrolase